VVAYTPCCCCARLNMSVEGKRRDCCVRGTKVCRRDRQQGRSIAIMMRLCGHIATLTAARNLTIRRVCFVLTALAFTSCPISQDRREDRGGEQTHTAQKVVIYHLFTWNVGTGNLCFALMAEPEDEEFIHRWFPKRNAKCGVGELKKALTALPKESVISWNNWPPKKIEYPPDAVVDEIMEFAEANGVRLELFPALD